MPPPSLSSLSLRLIACLYALLILPACSTPPSFLGDSDIIPVGSRIEFWVDHDDHGWVASNIHIAYLPRVMTGAEARRWAEGVGQRDAGIRWTRYYLLVTHPEPEKKEFRTAVYSLRSHPYEMTGRAPVLTVP
ncbi:hypothetical protein EI77_02568 [Prosthecobacter fusiformis]|uniref:Uncharacterized protein n=1 Tax=Prosthecobacter fusiformis TaxID=48464 RepID=A0A4R7RZM3_9BACT|nr:hypothetical protein [Prosthecobacter fusiformis]TDU71444.1 hypothetical protein EI77_02568 [Prosthecobacter fusiformis]